MSNQFAKLSVKQNENGTFRVEDDLGRTLPACEIKVEAGMDMATLLTVTVYAHDATGQPFINKGRHGE